MKKKLPKKTAIQSLAPGATPLPIRRRRRTTRRIRGRIGGGAIGIDIVEIRRLAKVSGKWGDGFLKKVYTDRELAYSRSKRFPCQHLAARFAAKEAIFKALGEVEKNFVGWKNIEILNDAEGKPVVHWHGKADEVRRKRKLKGAVVSLSHTDNYAVASAMLFFGR